MHRRAGLGDNACMEKITGLGVGTSVALGALIGLGIVSPGFGLDEAFATMLFYGGMSGLIFELYSFAFSWKSPSRR